MNNPLIRAAASSVVSDMMANFQREMALFHPIEKVEGKVIVLDSYAGTTEDDLNAMTKPELLTLAEQRGVKAARSWTKAKIIAALQPAETTVA